MLETINYGTLFLIPLLTGIFTIALNVFFVVMIVRFDKRDKMKVEIFSQLTAQNDSMKKQISELEAKVKNLENK